MSKEISPRKMQEQMSARSKASDIATRLLGTKSQLRETQQRFESTVEELESTRSRVVGLKGQHDRVLAEISTLTDRIKQKRKTKDKLSELRERESALTQLLNQTRNQEEALMSNAKHLKRFTSELNDAQGKLQGELVNLRKREARLLSNTGLKNLGVLSAMIPEVLLDRDVAPELQQRLILDQLKEVLSSLIDQVPNVDVSLGVSGVEPHVSVSRLNNYLFQEEDGTEMALGSSVMCDATHYRRFGPNLVFGLSDGSSFGPRARDAATRAVHSAVEHTHLVLNRQVNLTLRELAAVQQDAILRAHDEVMRTASPMSDPRSAGRTTLDVSTLVGSYLMTTGLGRSRILVLSPRGPEGQRLSRLEVQDLSQVKARFLVDPRDQGGALGPCVEDSGREPGPDLRNLAISLVQVSPQDVVLLCSDGLYANLTPAAFGLSVEETRDTVGLEVSTPWAEVERRYVELRLEEALADASGTEAISQSLDRYCRETTRDRKRAYMLEGVEPEDRRRYPGFLDHAAHVVVAIH